MPQGASLREAHTWNVGQEWYVDAVNGDDTTGDGSSGNPWQTLQKAADYLAATATWVAAGQDVRVNILDGTYQELGVDSTLETAFSSADRAPASNRYLIWAAVNPGSVVIQCPENATGGNYAIQVGTNALNSYQIFYGLDLDGEQDPRGTGNGCSVGLYLAGTVADSNTHIEVLNCSIHGFYPNSGIGDNADGVFANTGSSFLLVDRCEVYDCGISTNASVQGHGLYLEAEDGQITNSVVRDNTQGYGIQFFKSGSAGSTHERNVVAGCTFDNNGYAGVGMHPDASDCVVKNNVFSNHNSKLSSSFGFQFVPASTSPGSGNVLDFNVYWNNWGGNFGVNGSAGALPTGWTQTNAVADDPKYVTRPPQFIAKGTTAQGTSSSIAPTLPAGIEADDVVYLFVMHHQPNGIGVIDTPSGWTEAAQGTYQSSAPANAGRAALFWKRMSGGESGTVTVTATGDTGTDTLLFGQSYLFRDCDPTGDPHESIAAHYGPGNATIDFDAVAPAGIERTLAAFGFNAAALTVGDISGYITKPDHDVTTAGTDGRMRLQWKRNVSTDGAKTATGGSTVGWATFHLALQPNDPTGHAEPDLSLRDDTSAAVGHSDTNYATELDFLGNVRPEGAEDAGAYEFGAEPPGGGGGGGAGQSHKRMRPRLSLSL